MGIFDIFNRDEKYKGFDLSPDVDVALQKQLIDRGRGSEVNTLTPEGIKKAETGIANTTPAIISVGKKSLAPAKTPNVVQEFGRLGVPETFKKEVVQPAIDTVLSSPKVLGGLEATVGKLEAVDEASKGLLKSDTGENILVQDMPMAQQIAGGIFHTFKNIGRGELGTAESVTNGMQWLGVESVAPLSNKLKSWQDAIAPENPTFADNLGAGIGSAVSFFLPGAGAMKATEAIGLFSPRIAALFGNSAMTAFEALAEAGDTWKTNKDQGKTEQEASSAATKTFWANAALIGLTNQVSYFNKIKGLKKLLVSSAGEGLQEFGQQIIQNLNTGKTGNQAFDGALEAGAIGLILGSVLGGAELEGSGINQIGIKNPVTEETAQVAVPKEFYRLETKDGNKYFETNEEAQDYASSNNAEGSYLITKQGFDEAIKVLESGNHNSFPFQNGLSLDQVKLDTTIKEIQLKTGLSKSEAGEVLDGIKNLMASERGAKLNTDEIFKEAVDKAKIEAGQTPDIIQEAIQKASTGLIKPGMEKVVLPEAVYHQTNAEADLIREGGFKMGKNSAFGSAAFFGEKANQLYGENQVKVNPKDFNLKTFRTVAQQQAYIEKFGGKKLSDAIINEGKYDGFIIPNPETGNVFGITNKEKLDAKLKEQQYVTTEEARAMSKSFKFIEELGLPVNAVQKLLTASGKEAFGKYYKGTISFIENPHKTTIPHEAVHAFLDLMMTSKQKQIVLDEVKRRYVGKKLNNAQAEEQLAEDFAKYYTKKFDNPATAKAPSSRLKQFFDWFIDQLKRLTGKGDIIERLYKDIETKKPGIIQKELIRRRMARIGYDISELQKEYYQNPDALTTKFLENVDVKNREVAGYQFLKDLLKSKSLPLKENERILIDDILETQFKDEKKINMQDFRDAVRTELLPLQVISSETYSDYGSSSVGLEDLEHTTRIYNSPFNHGYSGHFGGDFARGIKLSDIEIKQIPGQNQWAVIRKGQELTEQNIAENVYNVLPSEELAKTWVENNTKKDFQGGEDTIDVGERGLFGHSRIWDEKDNYASADTIGGIRYVAEIQSDAFQNPERIAGINKELNMLRSDIKAAQEGINEEEAASFSETSERDINSIKRKIASYKKDIAVREPKIKELENQLASEKGKAERQFLSYKNTWHERIIREEIRQAAMDNKTKLRFPTPYTIAKIEGYLGEGQIPMGTNPGETFEYAGSDYTFLEFGNDEETYGEVAPSSDIRGQWSFDEVRQEDIDRETEDLVGIVKDIENDEELNDQTDDYFDSDQLKKLKQYIADNEDAEIEAMLSPIVEQRIDERYTDANSYADYYNDEIAGEKLVYPTLDGDIISLNTNSNVESLSFGSESDKESFNYEEDLESQEQKTVARFYDKQVGRYLAKLRKQNFKIVTDDNGYDWYETDILPEDKSAVEAFQTKPTEEPISRTGKQVADYVYDIELESDYSSAEAFDDNLRDIIEKQNFTLQSIKIRDLKYRDEDLNNYITAGEQRYPEGTDTPENVDLPIVVGNWNDGTYGVLDGYNRVLTKFKDGQEYIEAWVAEPDYSKMTGEDLRKRMKFGFMAGEEELSEYGMDTVGATYEMADLAMIDGKPALAVSWFEDSLAGISVHPDFQRKGLASAFIKYIAKEDGGSIKVYDPNKDMTSLLNKLGEVSEADGAGVVTLTLKPEIKYQEMTEEQKSLIAKRRAERIVEKATIQNISLKNAMNIVNGKERPITITKKESVLLRTRLRDMAKASKEGYSLGRAEMRSDLNLAFAGKLQYAKMIKNAVIAYARELPISLRGDLLPAVANATSIKDMAKAFARIDAALKNADVKDQLQRMKKMAVKVKKAMKTGRGIAVDYQKKIADILNEYNLQTPTANTIEKLNSLSEYIAEHPEANIPEHLVKRLNDLKKKSAKEISGETLSELNDLLSRLWSLGELKMEMKGKYDERFIRSSVDQLLLTTRNSDNSSIPGLSLLHAPRVADVFDGFRQYKGYNVALQKRVNQAVTQSVVSTKTIVEEAASTIAAIKNEFTREEQAAMAFQMAIDQGLYSQAQMLIGAYSDEFGWKTEADIKITPEMQTAIDTLRGTFNSTADYLAAVYEEIENKPFIKNDNYFPIKYDRSFDKKLDIEAPTVNQMVDFSTKQINKGFTFARMKGVKKVLRIDIFNVFSEAIAEQQYYMRVQPVINEIANIVSDSRYQERLGKVGSQWWDLYLKSVANKGKIPNFGVWKYIDPGLRAIKMNLSNAVLGYKIGSALIQPTSIIDAYSYVYLNHGALAANALIMRLAGTLTLPGYAKSITKRSVGLQIRTGGELTIREMQETPMGSKIGRAYRAGGMWLLKTMDTLTASAVHQTMYKHFKGKGMSESEARTEADFVMNLTQGSSEIADIPLILSSGELARTILTFQTFVLNRWGIMAHDILRSAVLHGNIGRKMKGLIALFLISMAGGLENYLRKIATKITTGKEYPEKFNFWQQSLLTVPETTPVVGSILSSVLEYNKGFSLPITRVVETLIQGAQGIISPAGETKSKREQNKIKGALKFVEAAATLYGVSGTSQLADFIERALIPVKPTRSAGGSNKSGIPTLPKQPALPKLPATPKLPAR